MMAKKQFDFRTVWYLLLLQCETSCPPQQQEQGLPAAVPGLATIDAKLLLLLLVLQCGAAVAVVWAHARTQELCLGPLGGGYTYHVEGHTRSKQALTSTVSQ